MLKGMKAVNREGLGRYQNEMNSSHISISKSNIGNIIKHVKTIPVEQAVSSCASDSNESIRPATPQSHTPGNNNIYTLEKIIVAIVSYEAKNSSELSFYTGDQFHVVGEDDSWYRVVNPATGETGKVSKEYFELVKSDGQASNIINNDLVQTNSNPNLKPKNTSLYSVVLYDFQAEKSDELTVYAGENLFVCAHHNYEWFIAKPIGRLGGPGLVPVDFVSIVDITTGYATGNNVKEDIDNFDLPTVQEWKMSVSKYKASNISLGSVDSPTASISTGQSMIRASKTPGLQINDVSVDSYTLEGERYWFKIKCLLTTGNTRELKRYYNDFYDLQVKLLDTFPAEAGKLRDSNGKWVKRILPYIPGPVPYVTESITKKRCDDLDVYLKKLIELPEYISNSNMVQELFMMKDNGFDNENSSSPIKGVQDVTVDSIRSPLRDLDKTHRVPSHHEIEENAEDSTLIGDELKVYDKMNDLSLQSTPKSRTPKASLPVPKPVKIKFYYKGDIFALLLNHNINLTDLLNKIASRVDNEEFRMYIRDGEEDGEEILNDAQVRHLIENRSKINVYDE